MQPELLDVLDEAGIHTGRMVQRGTPLRPGEFLLAVHIWPRNASGAYLIQRRALHLKAGPGVWAATVGYVQAGESSVAAAVREIYEELGLRLDAHELRLFKRVITGALIQDVYLAQIAGLPGDAIAFGPDVMAVRWISKTELAAMIGRAEFFAYSYFGELPAEPFS